MALTSDQVRQIAKLARLHLTDAEIEKLTKELSSILEYVEQLNKVDTKNVEPTAQVTGLKNVTREDKVAGPGSAERLADPDALLACSTQPIEDHQIKVKSVF